MKRSFQCLSLALVLLTGTQAQENISKQVKTCATEAPPPEWDTWFNQKVEEHKQNIAAGKAAAAGFTIPVIVHVIYGATNTPVGTFPNLSQAQINSQIGVLNADFAGAASNVGNLAATGFSAVGAADCKMHFCLAQLDPNGNVLPEPGIDRISYIARGWSNPTSFGNVNSFISYMDGIVKAATIWDPQRYLNIWISDANILPIRGYAYFPAGSGLSGLPPGSIGNAGTDGIWVWSRSFGNIGTLQPLFNLGHTATHEVGHWLGVRHIGGDGGASGSCSATDYCADTPPQRGGFGGSGNGQNYGQPSYPLYATGSNSCSGAPLGNMFMNFMDWVDDPACYMFTPGQAQRMATAMTNGTYRQYLTASSATLCGLSVASPSAMFSIQATGCTGVGIQPGNQTSGTTPGYQWSALPATAVTFNPNNAAANPTVTFNLPGTYNLVLLASNAGGSSSYTQTIVVDECTGGTGIADVSTFQRSIVLAPNPTAGVVDITVALKDQNKLNVKVNNTLGQQLIEVSFDASSSNKYTLDLHHFVNGVYFITLHSGADKAVKRIIINK